MVYDEDLGKQVKYIAKEKTYIYKYANGSLYNTDCFACVCKAEDNNAFIDINGSLYTEGMQITLFIWPYYDTYGLDFFSMTNGEEFSKQIYVDKDLNCLSNYNKDETDYINRLIKENKKDIEKLFKAASEKWKLN